MCCSATFGLKTRRLRITVNHTYSCCYKKKQQQNGGISLMYHIHICIWITLWEIWCDWPEDVIIIKISIVLMYEFVVSPQVEQHTFSSLACHACEYAHNITYTHSPRLRGRGLGSWQASKGCAKNKTNYADIWRRLNH